MGDENARHMHVTEKAEHEPAEFLPVANVQCGKRLIHQDKAGLCHDSPAEGSPLTLAAGEFPGVFLRMRKDPQIFQKPVCLFPVRALSAQAQGEEDIFADGLPGEETVILEDHGDFI